MLFKNAMFYQSTGPLNIDLSTLNEKLVDFCFIPCKSIEAYRIGWCPPFEGAESLFHYSDGCLFLSIRVQTKVVPIKVVNQSVKDRVNEIEKEDDRKIGRKERLQLRDEVVSEMLPNALVESSWLNGYIDIVRGLIVIDATSSNKAETWLDLLRQTLGSLPVIPLGAESGPALVMFDWLADDSVPQAIDELGSSAKLISDLHEGSSAVMKDVELVGSDHLEGFTHVAYLDVEFDRGLSARICDDLSLKKLRYDSDDGYPEAGEGVDQRALNFDTDLFVLRDEIRRYIDFVKAEFGLHSELIPAAVIGLEGDQESDMWEKIQVRMSGAIQALADSVPEGMTMTISDAAGNNVVELENLGEANVNG